MKKLHGTHSIQPLTITDAVIAEDAAIDESKLRLSFNTVDIQNNLDNFSLAFTTHANTSADPHGETLQQTILQTEDIRSDAGDLQRTITMSNPGEGDVLLNVEGDIAAVNASFSGDTNIAGITTIGGQTHITGNVVIDGNLSVSGETTTVESNTIDYDSLLVTPSTALNRTGIVVAPDGTGFDGDDQSQAATGDTFLGNLLELQTRTNGLNEAAVIVDKSGNLRLLTGGLEVGGITGTVNNNTLTFDKGLGAASMITSNAGFIYKPSSDAQPGSKVLDIQDASGVSNAFITKNGDTTVNSITIGASNPITEVGTGLNVPNDVCIGASELLLSDSVLTFAAENKDEWRVLNRNSSISAYFDADVVPQVELSDDLLDASNCELTKTDNLEVMGAALFRGSVSMAANTTVDGIRVGSHDHTGGEMGTVLPQTAVTGLKTFIDNINTTIKNCVNEMTTSNTESGIDVAYNSNTGKLDLSVNDFTITLSGDASGSATIQHASDTTLSVTVLDSAKLGGLSLSSSTANTDANRVLRTDANGKTSVKALIMSSPTAAGTGTLGKIYASVGNETEVKSYTPANFATQLLALGGTAKNSHTHTAVNGLTPIRGSSTFNGVSGRVIMLASSRSNTNYSVAVTPSAAPIGHLGEVWVIKGTDRFTVYNSGSATTAFDYIMLG